MSEVPLYADYPELGEVSDEGVGEVAVNTVGYVFLRPRHSARLTNRG